MKTKVWFITGCSTGFGHELAEYALETGNKVVVTARNVSQVQDLIDAYPETSLALTLDVVNGNLRGKQYFFLKLMTKWSFIF